MIEDCFSLWVMDKDLSDFYSDYLLSSCGATTATVISALLDSAIRHEVEGSQGLMP